MKLPNRTILLGLTCMFVYLLFSGLECNDNEPENTDSNCENFRSLKVTWLHNPNEQGEKLLDPMSHVSQNNSVGVQFTYNVEVPEKVLCTKELTAVDFYITLKKDDAYESSLGASIILGDKTHLPVWDQSEDNEKRYFHAGKTINGDPNGTKVGYELLITVTIFKKEDEEVHEIADVFDNLYEKIQIDWFYYEW